MIDRPNDDQMHLLSAIAAGMRDDRGRLPTRRWVMLQLEDLGLDGEGVLRRLPTWAGRYRSVRIDHQTAVDPNSWEKDDRLSLTFHGRFHVGDDLSRLKNHVFVAALAIAAERRARMRDSSPYEVIRMDLPRNDTIVAVNRNTGSHMSDSDLVGLFASEPPTWGLTSNIHSWDISHANLWPFRGVSSNEMYLSILDELFIAQTSVNSLAPPLPLALPEALEFFDLAWRLSTAKGPLLIKARLSAGGALTQPANSEDEFNARCSVLKNVFDQMTVPPSGDPQTAEKEKAHKLGKLMALQGRLVEHAPAAKDEILEAIATLRSIVALRNAQQHPASTMDQRAATARVKLGLRRFGGDWSHDWDTIRAETIRAVGVLREALVSTLPD